MRRDCKAGSIDRAGPRRRGGFDGYRRPANAVLRIVYAEVLMAYVGSPLGFDIFISYSHGDDGSGNAYLASVSKMRLGQRLQACS